MIDAAARPASGEIIVVLGAGDEMEAGNLVARRASSTTRARDGLSSSVQIGVAAAAALEPAPAAVVTSSATSR